MWKLNRSGSGGGQD